MSTKLSPQVINAFQAAGISLQGAEVITTCAVLIGGRYVAFYANHGGWQIGKDRTPKTRVTVTQDQAVAWALRGEWTDGSACLNGYRVVDGVEKGRKAPEATETQTSTAALSSVVVDDATALKAKALLAAVQAGLTPAQIAAIFGV